MESRKLWQAVLGELEIKFTKANFNTWFRNTAIIKQEDGHVVIAVPNAFTRDWLEKKFGDAIRESVTRISPNIQQIDYKIAGTSPATSPGRDQIIAPAEAPVTPVAAANPAQAAGKKLNQRYTLDSFVVGSSNDLAYAASQAVAANPGHKYNPLFIYGGVGLGKTHLIQAIGNEITAKDPSKNVLYVTSEQFTNEFISNVSGKSTKKFASRYRNLDVLIVDDIQFLGNKEKTQEEFFHTFNTLHQANKQVILSSDKPPRDIPNLEDRLRSRFEWGMVADIQKPDLETRAAIIQRKAESRGINLSPEVVERIARHYQHNIRELEGALTGILAQCELKNREPSEEFVSMLLGASAPAQRRKMPTPRMVLEKTASYFDLNSSDLTGPRRDKDIVVPRQIAMYIMREELRLSFPKIAKNVGGRDHTTAMHSVSKISKMLEFNEELRSEVSQIRERVTT
jgi:chromosomal replication initiator protein